MAEPGGTAWLSVPEAARRLGISERAVRKRIAANALEAVREGGGPWRVRVGTADAAPIGTTIGTDPARDGTTGGTAEPIEAAYRVTPAEIEQAVSRTSAQYMGDLRTMLAEVGKVYEGQLAAKDAAIEAKDQALALQTAALEAKDETIATKDQALAAHALTITELRRRADLAEAQLQRRLEADQARILRQAEAEQARQRAEEAVQAVQAALPAQAAPAEVQGDPPNLWEQLRRWWIR